MDKKIIAKLVAGAMIGGSVHVPSEGPCETLKCETLDQIYSLPLYHPDDDHREDPNRSPPVVRISVMGTATTSAGMSSWEEFNLPPGFS
jgi:hypothetical protein